MTRERLANELEKVQKQIAILQEREKQLAADKEMADIAAAREIVEKKKISPELLKMLCRYKEDEIRMLLKQRETERLEEKENENQ